MKNLNLTTSVKVLLIAAMVLISSAAVKAEGGQSQSTKKHNCAIGNLTSGITSDNLGLKKSSIYFAGEYKVTEVLPVLNSQLKKESDPSTRILIALVIYRMGDSEGIRTVKNLAVSDSNPEVRRMCASIYNAYINNSAEEIAFTNN